MPVYTNDPCCGGKNFPRKLKSHTIHTQYSPFENFLHAIYVCKHQCDVFVVGCPLWFILGKVGPCRYFCLPTSRIDSVQHKQNNENTEAICSEKNVNTQYSMYVAHTVLTPCCIRNKCSQEVDVSEKQCVIRRVATMNLGAVM